jgi:hypothetical protein
MVIQVLETVTKEEKKKREKSWLCAANTSSVWHTGLSGGAPDSVRCARLAGDETTALGKTQRRTTIIHQTVRWCTGLSGEPMVASATVGRAIRERRVARSNGRLDTHTGLSGVHRTIRCANRPRGLTVGCVRKGRRSRTGQL